MRVIDADALKNASIRKPRGVDSYAYGAMVTMFMDAINEAPTIPNATAELKKMAYELLGMYEESRGGIIYEYSGRIEEDEADLAKLIQEYKDRIEKLCS